MSNKDPLNDFQKRVQHLRKVANSVCQNGTFNYDAYMFGLANGLLCAKAIMENSKPVYLSPPMSWISDSKQKDDLS